MARLSVVIVSFNSAATLPVCLQALRDHGPMPPHDIVVVDNASQDGTAAMLARDWPAVTAAASRTRTSGLPPPTTAAFAPPAATACCS